MGTDAETGRDAPPSYQELLDGERNPVPPALRAVADVELGSEPLSVERYLSPAYHELEKAKLWPRVWQATCRESEIASAGDFYDQPLELNRADSTFMNHRGVLFASDDALTAEIQGLLPIVAEIQGQ